MARSTTYDVDPANVSLTGLLSNATGATWTLSANNAGDSLAHQISIRNDSVTDHSAKTALLTGTDARGEALTETVNLPNTSATVESTKYFLTLTSIVPSATIGADTMDIGWVDEVTTVLYPLDWRSTTPATYAVSGLSGTIDFDLDETFVDFQNSIDMEDLTFVTKKNDTANVIQVGTANATGVRLKVNSYTNTAELQFSISQTSNAN